MKKYHPFMNLDQARRAGFLDEDFFLDDEAIRERQFIPIKEVADSTLDPQNILIAAEEEEERWIEKSFEESDTLASKIRNFEDKISENIPVKTAELAEHVKAEIKEEFFSVEAGEKNGNKKQRRLFIGQSRGKRGREPWWKGRFRHKKVKEVLWKKLLSSQF